MLTVRISVDRARVNRGTAWIKESRIVERSEGAWDRIRRDERSRVVGLIVASIALSVAVSVLATVLVRAVESRRAGSSAAAEGEPAGEAEPVPADAPAPDAPAEASQA
jgi:hypothetical protein